MTVTGLRKRFERGPSGFSVEGTVLPLAGSRGNGSVPAPARTEQELRLVLAWARLKPACFPSQAFARSKP
jgi:hypothetical protein